MAVRKIITTPNPTLEQKTSKIKSIDEETKKIAQDLIDTVRVAKDPEGAGLAATQIGVSKRLCVVRNFYEDPTNPEKIQTDDIILINPKIISTSKETELDWEGCLSVPDKYGLVQRFKKIKVTAQDLEGNNIKIKADGFFARVIQHEIDHLDGILFSTKIVGKTLSQKEFDQMLESEIHGDKNN